MCSGLCCKLSKCCSVHESSIYDNVNHIVAYIALFDNVALTVENVNIAFIACIYMQNIFCTAEYEE